MLSRHYSVGYFLFGISWSSLFASADLFSSISSNSSCLLLGVYDNCSDRSVVNPIGNAFATSTSFSVHGETRQESSREFLVDFGLISNRGNQSNPPETPYHDKVTLYASIEGQTGSGDIWAINPLVTQAPNSGSAYNAQGIELDFNNNNAHRGDEDAGGGLAEPVSYGFSITGAGAYRSTSAMLISGNRAMWNRGIVVANDCVNASTFQDLGSPKKSIDIRGNPTYGIYQSSPQTKNYFAGSTAHEGAAVTHKKNHVVVSFGGERREVVRAGNAVLTTRGDAAIALEGYDDGEHAHVYSLTSVGSRNPDLHVASEVDAHGVFRIAGGFAGSKVSWVVRSRVEVAF